ncbi:MAG: hypothetical protein E7141_03675 [Rikenellaceae bacterium]|nr:hypothetical protein [Rikenellaceae bacterium]
MKKIFTLMLTLACAMFVGMSCTPDNGLENENEVKASVVTVTGAPEANLAPEAGEFTLNYAIQNATLTGALEVTSDAAWIHVGEIGEATVAFTYDANTDAPGTPAREAVISFAYTDAETVSVSVKQDSATPSFEIAWHNVTCGSAQYTCTPADSEMLFLLASTQDLGQYGVQGETPQELMKNYAEMLAMYGMLNGEADQWFVFKGATTEMPKDASRFNAEDIVSVFAVGISVTVGEMDPETQMPAISVEYLTPVHAWDVPFLPYPTLTVPEAQLTNNVSAAAGELVLDCVLENALSDGSEVTLSTEATWVHPTWADNKLTIAYDANETAVARRAKIAVQYGWWTNPFEVTVIQEKNADATAITLNITVKETHFNSIIVDIDCSDDNAWYALNTLAQPKDWETGAPLEVDWTTEAENIIGYPGQTKFLQGDQSGYVIKMNPSNYEWYGYDYYVFGFAVAMNEDNTAATAQIGEVASVLTKVDASDMPVLTWDVEKSGLVWNENSDRYDIEVAEGSTLVLYYNVENPVEGAAVKLNGTSLYDSYNVVDGEPVIDNAAGTVTLKIDKFDTAKKYHYVNVTFKYTNAEEDMWGITTPNVRITQVEAPKATEIVITPDQIASINKAGSYYLADGTNQDVTNEATWLKWVSAGVNIEACRVLLNNQSTPYNGLLQFQGDASNVAKQGFLGNATSNGEIKQVIIEAYSSYATPSFNVYYGDAKLPKDSAKVLNVVDHCVKGESKGKDGNYEVFSFTCTFDIPAGNEFFAVRNDSKGATYIKSITVKY